MVRRVIVGIIVIAIVVVAANDLWRYASAQRELRDTTYELARWAAENAGSMPSDALDSELASRARLRGVTVYQYTESDQGVELRTRTTVEGTFVLGGIWNLVTGKPLAEAFQAPFVITDVIRAGTR